MRFFLYKLSNRGGVFCHILGIYEQASGCYNKIVWFLRHNTLDKCGEIKCIKRIPKVG